MENGSLVDYLRSPVEISIHEGLRFAYHASKGLYRIYTRIVNSEI